MCAVAVASSPVFSPSSRSLFCKTVSSPDHHHHHHYGSCSPSPRSGSGSVPVSSPFRVRLQKSPSGLRKEGLDIPDTGCSTSSSSAGPVKRKRPARIDIPVASLSFGAVAEGVAEVEMEVDRENYSVYCKKGRRAAMEDRYSAVVDLDGDSKQALFGVFDGHGGVKAAEFTAENLHKNITNELRTRREEETVVEAVKCGYLTTDTEFIKEDVHGGTCCVTALIKKNHLVVSNAGDCRAVMSRGGVAEALTSDHRPSREDEKERIETSGGYVDCCRGVWRLNGSLAVSRGIGDRHLKQWVIAEPETKVLSIEPDCEFLVLASDGLWDKISNQEAIDLARPLFADATKPDMLTACKRLTDLAVTRGSADDISVMVILLGKFIEPGVYENVLQL